MEREPLKILIVTPYLPHLRIGMAGGLLVRDMIKYLARKHHVSLLSMISQGEDKYVPELEQICDRVETVKFLRLYDTNFMEKVALLWDRAVKLTRSLLSTNPYIVKKYWSRKLANILREWTSEEPFDIVQLEFTQFGQYRSYAKAKATVWDEHDVSFVPRFREYRKERSLFMKLYRRLEWHKCLKYEVNVGEHFDYIFTLTDNDRHAILAFNPNLKVSAVQTGMDLDHIQPIQVEEEKDTLVYMGSFSHRPNVDAVVYFREKIYPIIRQQKPNINTYIMGKNEDFLPKLPDDFVITGFCEDVAPILSKCEVFIAPITWGGGIKIKLLHAMALGRPVVTTPVGAEGLDVEHGVHLLIAKNPEEFARYVIDLLDNPQLRRRIAQAGLQKVRERYSWERIIADIEDLYYSLLAD